MIETTYSNVQVGKSKFTAKVFLYMFAALLITAISATIVGFIFSNRFPIAYDGVVNQENLRAYTTTLIVCIVLYIPLIIWIQIAVLRNKGKPLVPYILYATLMGVLFSSFTMFIPFYLIAIAFGITCVAFLSMFCIGYFAKRDLSFLAMIAFGALIGIFLMSLFNLIWMLIFPATFQMFYWIVDIAFFLVVILLTIVDFQNVRRLADAGTTDKKTALICAFSLYVDFIYIFIKILTFVVRIYASSKR